MRYGAQSLDLGGEVGLERVPHGDRYREIGVRQSRIELRMLLDQARDDGHSVVIKHDDGSAVVVPYDWLRSTLLGLLNDEAPLQCSYKDGSVDSRPGQVLAR